MAKGIREVDAIVQGVGGWRGETLARVRALVLGASAGIVEEVKWKKPSKPEGVPVWSEGGIVCIGEALKGAVRLTFPKGAQLADPSGLFNARLGGTTVRAVDLHEGEAIPRQPLVSLVREAVRANLGD